MRHCMEAGAAACEERDPNGKQADPLRRPSPHSFIMESQRSFGNDSADPGWDGPGLPGPVRTGRGRSPGPGESDRRGTPARGDTAQGAVRQSVGALSNTKDREVATGRSVSHVFSDPLGDGIQKRLADFRIEPSV